MHDFFLTAIGLPCRAPLGLTLPVTSPPLSLDERLSSTCGPATAASSRATRPRRRRSSDTPETRCDAKSPPSPRRALLLFFLLYPCTERAETAVTAFLHRHLSGRGLSARASGDRAPTSPTSPTFGARRGGGRGVALQLVGASPRRVHPCPLVFWGACWGALSTPPTHPGYVSTGLHR